MINNTSERSDRDTITKPIDNPTPSRATSNSQTDPALNLLEKRQAWCLLPEIERSLIDTVLRNQQNNASTLQRIILTSCAPEQYAAQSQELIKSINRKLLSEAERSLLMLIETTNRDLLHAQQERDTSKKALRNTIDGISSIENKINEDSALQPRGQQ